MYRCICDFFLKQQQKNLTQNSLLCFFPSIYFQIFILRKLATEWRNRTQSHHKLGLQKNFWEVSYWGLISSLSNGNFIWQTQCNWLSQLQEICLLSSKERKGLEKCGIMVSEETKKSNSLVESQKETIADSTVCKMVQKKKVTTSRKRLPDFLKKI